MSGQHCRTRTGPENSRVPLHAWTQIVDKTRLASTPLENHCWDVTLDVAPRGLNTSSIPFRRQTLEPDSDLIAAQTLRSNE